MKRLLALIALLSATLSLPNPTDAADPVHAAPNWQLMARLIDGCNAPAMQNAINSYPFVDPNDEWKGGNGASPFLWRVIVTRFCDDDAKLKMMKVLLDAKEDPNHPLTLAGSNQNYLTLVMGNFKSQWLAGVQMLLEHGADPNAPSAPIPA
jgi:hypothetical protein